MKDKLKASQVVTKSSTEYVQVVGKEEVQLHEQKKLDCKLCVDTGIINNDYCSCDRGVFYETRNELWLQIEVGELDIGQD